MLDATWLSVLPPQCPLLLQHLHDQQGTSGTLFASCCVQNKSRCSPCLVLRLYSLALCPSEVQVSAVFGLVIPNFSDGQTSEHELFPLPGVFSRRLPVLS